MGRRNSTRIEFHDTWKLHAIQVSSSISKLLVHSPAHAPSMALLPRPHPLHRPVTATATFALRGQRRVAATRPSGPQGLKHLLSPLKTGRLSSGKGWWCAPGAGQALGSRGGAEAGCCRAVGSGLRPCLTQGPHARPTITATSQKCTPRTQEATDTAWTWGQEGGASRVPSASVEGRRSLPQVRDVLGHLGLLVNKGSSEALGWALASGRRPGQAPDKAPGPPGGQTQLSLSSGSETPYYFQRPNRCPSQWRPHQVHSVLLGFARAGNARHPISGTGAGTPHTRHSTPVPGAVPPRPSNASRPKPRSGPAARSPRAAPGLSGQR